MIHRMVATSIFRSSGLTMAMVLSGFALFSACNSGGSEKVSLEDHEQALQRRDSLINDMLLSFQDIENTLKSIAEKEQLLTLNPEGELAGSERERVINDINALGEVLAENRNKIAELEKKIAASGIEASSLRKKVKELNAELETRWNEIQKMENRIAEKDAQIADLVERVDSVVESLAMRDQTIEATRVELQATSTALSRTTTRMNQAYMITGTRKELKEKGLLDTRLIGPSTLNESLTNEGFRPLDIRETRSIELASSKPELITYHPQGSYKVVPTDEKGSANLEITNPDEFWKVSKYLVVALK
jgi:hypothetical protein